MTSIVIIGATGNIGKKILDEALARGHKVTGITRNAANLPAEPGLTVKQADTADVAQLADALKGNDEAVVSVKFDVNDIDKIIEAVRRAGVKKSLFVVGAGSLLRDDGRLHFEHMTPPPPSSKPAMVALEQLKQVKDFDWTAMSPPGAIKPGERTGKFRYGDDTMLMGETGPTVISQEDFAIAVLDEVETPKHTGRRFTVGY